MIAAGRVHGGQPDERRNRSRLPDQGESAVPDLDDLPSNASPGCAWVRACPASGTRVELTGLEPLTPHCRRGAGWFVVPAADAVSRTEPVQRGAAHPFADVRVGQLVLPGGQINGDRAGPAPSHLVQHSGRRAEQAGSAVSALEPVVIDERLLQRVQAKRRRRDPPR
jgi:hypothetical protein